MREEKDSDPQYMRRVNNAPDIDGRVKAELLEQVEDCRAKPWTIVARASRELGRERDEVRKALRELTLRGKITLTADGDLRKPIP